MIYDDTKIQIYLVAAIEKFVVLNYCDSDKCGCFSTTHICFMNHTYINNTQPNSYTLAEVKQQPLSNKK